MNDDAESLASTADLLPSPLEGVSPTDARLVVVHPPHLVRRLTLPCTTMTFGRAPGESFGLLSDKTVSRRHFEIRWDEGAAIHRVADLSSHNGSWVDGKPLGRTPVPLHDGAVLRAGSMVAVYEVVPATLVDAPTLAEAIPGGSAPVARLRHEIASAARDPAPVLVVGATGVGKEHTVRVLHELSGRPGPLVAVNTSELSPLLLESQLFGHEKGAFTGALTAQPGLFRHADGGTLLLDEIGELPLELQPKLLRVIQEQVVRPVGGTRATRVNVRIVAATNRDLRAEVERGRFRRDLWARLAILQIDVPTLAERRGDIVDWIQRLHQRWCAERGQVELPRLQFESEAIEALLLMEWPENLRGLDRLVHRLATFTARGPLASGPTSAARVVEILGASPRAEGNADAQTSEAATPVRRAAPRTAEELAQVLARFGGQVSATARWYGRNRRQVYRWMKALELQRTAD